MTERTILFPIAILGLKKKCARGCKSLRRSATIVEAAAQNGKPSAIWTGNVVPDPDHRPWPGDYCS